MTDADRSLLRGLIEQIASIAWTCVKQCKDHSGPPVMCVTHQLEAEEVLRAYLAGHPCPSTEERKPKRYDLVMNYRCGLSIEEMEPADDGEWVRYEDVATAVPSPADPQPPEPCVLVTGSKVVCAWGSVGCEEFHREMPVGHPSPEAQKDEARAAFLRSAGGLDALNTAATVGRCRWHGDGCQNLDCRDSGRWMPPADPSPATPAFRLRVRAEALWEELGGDLCICQWPDVPHWCEKCQGRIDLIQSALLRAGHPTTEAQKDEGYQEALHRPVGDWKP